MLRVTVVNIPCTLNFIESKPLFTTFLAIYLQSLIIIGVLNHFLHSLAIKNILDDFKDKLTRLRSYTMPFNR